jgi:hypothetical protein
MKRTVPMAARVPLDKKEIMKIWKSHYPTLKMNKQQTLMLDTFLGWYNDVVFNEEPMREARVLHLHLGRRAGNSALWRVIRATYMNKMTLVAPNMTIAKQLDTEVTEYNLKDYMMGRNLGLVIFDCGCYTMQRDSKGNIEGYIGQGIDGVVYA